MTRYMRKKDGDPFVYLWTPTLEARGDFEFVDGPSAESADTPVSEEAREEMLLDLVEALETPPPSPEDDSPNPLTE